MGIHESVYLNTVNTTLDFGTTFFANKNGILYINFDFVNYLVHNRTNRCQRLFVSTVLYITQRFVNGNNYYYILVNTSIKLVNNCTILMKK